MFGVNIIPGLYADQKASLSEACNRVLYSGPQNVAYEKDGSAYRSVYDLDKEDRYFMELLHGQRVKSVFRQYFKRSFFVHQYKLNPKYPTVGRGWSWHQDSWFMLNNKLSNQEFPLQHNINCFHLAIAVDSCEKHNGLLKFILGSHLAGVYLHESVCGSFSINEKTLDTMLKRLDIFSPELAAGDAVLFHCDLVHSSDENGSAGHRRMVYLSAYDSDCATPVPHRHTSLARPPREEDQIDT
ncbi:phytanoyl-CoA dioxygenase family protein [Thalassobaculum litoreum]